MWSGRRSTGAAILLCTLVASLPFVHQLYGYRSFSVAYTASLLLWFPLWRRGSIPTHLLLGGAIAIRLLLLAHQPALSGDVWRYLLDAKSTLAGVSPYQFAPVANPLIGSDAATAAIAAEVNHPEIASIYPPLAQLAFLVSGGSLLLWRIALIAAEIGTIALLVRMRQRRAAIAYAFAPLLLVESAWNAHLESIVALMLLLAFHAKKTSAVALAAAVGLKITPFVAIPAIAKRFRWSFRYKLIFSASLLFPFAFFLGGRLMPGFRDYASRWIFNAPLFEALRWSVAETRFDSAMHLLWSRAKDPWAPHWLSDFVYSSLHPDALARALAAVLLIIALVFITRHARSAAVEIAAAFTALMLLSPTVHPWYWIAALPILLIGRHPLPVWMAMLAPVSYLLYADGRRGSVAVASICYALPVMVWLLEKRFRDVSRLRSERAPLPP